MRLFQKQYSVIMLLCCIFLAGLQFDLAGQSTRLFELEKKIKTNPDIIYIQSKENDTLHGKENALKILWESEDLQKDLLTNKTLSKSNTSYLIKPRGDSFMIIAYINKVSESNIVPTEKPATLTTDKKVPAVTAASSVKTHPKSEVPAAEKSKKQASGAIVSKEYSTESKLHKSNSVVLNDLSKFPDFDAAVRYLNKQKMHGNVVYSHRMDAFPENIGDCYIMIYNTETGKIEMLLAKGNSERMNVLNSQKISRKDYTDLTNTFNNLYIYEF